MRATACAPNCGPSPGLIAGGGKTKRKGDDAPSRCGVRLVEGLRCGDFEAGEDGGFTVRDGDDGLEGFGGFGGGDDGGGDGVPGAFEIGVPFDGGGEPGEGGGFGAGEGEFEGFADFFRDGESGLGALCGVGIEDVFDLVFEAVVIPISAGSACGGVGVEAFGGGPEGVGGRREWDFCEDDLVGGFAAEDFNFVTGGDVGEVGGDEAGGFGDDVGFLGEACAGFADGEGAAG